jgi:hypothetical protein
LRDLNPKERASDVPGTSGTFSAWFLLLVVVLGRGFLLRDVPDLYRMILAWFTDRKWRGYGKTARMCQLNPGSITERSLDSARFTLYRHATLACSCLSPRPPGRWPRQDRCSW